MGRRNEHFSHYFRRNMLKILILLGFFQNFRAWKIVFNGNRGLNGADFDLPIYTIDWGPNETATPLQTYQAYKAWALASGAYLAEQGKTAIEDYRQAMFCYPGPSPFLLNGTSNETQPGSLPECSRFRELHQRLLTETKEFLDMIPDDQSLKEVLSNNATSFLDMLRLQKTRLGELIGYYPNLRSPMLSPFFDRITQLIEASMSWKGVDHDLWAPPNSTVFPGWPNNNWNFTSLNETLHNRFGKKRPKFGNGAKGDTVRLALAKAFGLNFTDDQWSNVTDLIKNHWRDLRKGGENTSAAREFEEIVSESGASESTLFDLKSLLKSGNLLQILRSGFGQQAQSSGNQVSQLLNQLMSTLKNAHQNNVNQFSQATANTQNLATGTLDSFFGGFQQLLSQLQG